MPTPYPNKIWIDLDNSPHVPFFRPIIRKLEEMGYSVVLTGRDCFQVRGLVGMYNLECEVIGRHYGRHKLLKVLGLFVRAMQLAPIVMEKKPAIALSHGSRSQLILATILGIPSICCEDYEPSKNLPFVKPTWLISPEIIPDYAIKMSKKAVIKYPGIKEDVYVPNFKPDSNIIDELGVKGEKLVITVRPPATEAHYHNPQSEELFKAAINFLGDKQDIQMILLPRNDKQKTSIKRLWPEWCTNGKIIIPDHVVDGLNLIWHSDLVISGGGTMNREAAALGVPVYSIFRGKIGAVDRYLSDQGRLVLLESLQDIKKKVCLNKRILSANFVRRNNDVLDTIVNSIVSILEK